MRYISCLWQFHLWLVATGQTVTELNVLDGLISRFCQQAADEGGVPSIGSMLMAAVLRVLPQLGRKIEFALPLSFRCLQGWSRLMPAKTRAPLPHQALFLIVAHFASLDRMDMALALWVGFH